MYGWNRLLVCYINTVAHSLPRDATQSAVLLWQVVCPSVCLSVRNVEVSWSHRLEFLENFTIG